MSYHYHNSLTENSEWDYIIKIKKTKIRSERTLDKVKEKFSKIEYRAHETSKNTEKKDKVSDCIKGMLKHMKDKMRKSKIYYSREQN